MVSFGPGRYVHADYGEDSSPASFEKALSTLSAKITATQLQLDKVRTRSRRIKVLWTLYLSFAYLVYAIVLILVVGYANLGVWEWVGMAGGPVLIYVMRTLTHTYFTMRIETLEARLKDLQTERATTIQKLKDATKYDSTHELLEKYGGEKPKRAIQNNDDDERHNKNTKDGDNRRGRHSSLGPNGPPSRTNFAPPATANIQRPPSAQGAPTSIRHPNLIPLPPSRPSSSHISPPRHNQQQHDFTAEFAPNADDLPHTPYPQYDHNPNNTPRWYDRILDLMLGEDETAPKNRIVLICQNCRLVNGQAPPGTKALADVGLWKCMSCGSMNGEMDEGKKIMREVLGGADTIRPSIEVTDNSDGGADEVGAQIMAEDAMATGLEERSSMGPRTRSRKSGRNKA
ncbi:hypothetical protein PG993_011872 [Apiospora rasikravindrae]|uniref:Endoplasmic reticulum junction formation protein lunapark n=1 Tax=Apiospora rasikravindrae TaxID=990691 RepID=A0ABR1S0V2_9PEZI